MRKHVYVALSGGVDSAVTAAMLVEQGFQVTGVFMKNWSGEDFGIEDECPWQEDLDDTMKICKHLGIEHKTYNFEKDYRELVISNFFDEYKRGNTPNPDVLCNKYIKFDKFLNKALEEGADLIATGHYSITKYGQLFKAKDRSKDQTYFLYQVTKEQLMKTLFPIGDLLKTEVRELAKKYNLHNADKKDSQGICFVGKIDIRDFLKTQLQEKSGDIVDIDTQKVVGSHNGVWFYTIGQRGGIKVGGQPEPYYVSKKDVSGNILYVALGKKHPSLWSSKLILENLHLIDSAENIPSSPLTAQIRYHGAEYTAEIDTKDQNNTTLEFAKPQWAVSSGQSAVLYCKNKCLGGGIISHKTDEI